MVLKSKIKTVIRRAFTRHMVQHVQVAKGDIRDRVDLFIDEATDELTMDLLSEKNKNDIKTEFFTKFGESSFRGYPLEQCHSIFEFFEPYLYQKNSDLEDAIKEYFNSKTLIERLDNSKKVRELLTNSKTSKLK